MSSPDETKANKDNSSKLLVRKINNGSNYVEDKTPLNKTKMVPRL